MILTDTSIWIEFLKSHEPIFTRLRDLLERREVITISPIFGELLQGVKNRNEKSIILEYWKYLPKIDESELFIKAGEHSSENNFISKGVGLIDACIIIAASENNIIIWTLDEKINRLLNQKMKYKV
jgi:predicted nucleic acid-binding protein